MKNVVMDPIFQLTTYISTSILDSVLDEHILEIKTNSLPWYAHIVNYLVTSKLLDNWGF